MATLKGDYRFFTTDPLQHLYLVTSSEELIKYDASGKELFRYSNFTLGRLGHIDATNPFSVLLYYPDFQAVVLLDRTLSQVGEINLLELDLPNTNAIGLDSDNFIWVYDPVRFQLRRLNIRGEVNLQSENLALSLPQPPEVGFLVARENQIFLSDSTKGLFILDNFGRLDRILPLLGLSLPSFQIRNQRIIFFQNHKLKQVLLQNLAEEEALLPNTVGKAVGFRLEQNLLFALFTDRLEIFQIKIP